MPDISLDPQTTALILIDLQQGIVARQGAPYATTDVVKKAAALAQRFREKNATIIYVRVDLANMLVLPVDQPMRNPDAPPPPPNASEIVPEAGIQPQDIVITKNQWGAFFGTDLEQTLRQRGIKTIVLGGVATNYGVESTARAAAGLGFALIIAEDACTSLDAAAHKFAMESIFPRIARVRSTEQILEGLE